MAKIGVSVYPEHSNLQKDSEYLGLCAKYGVKRVFSCLLSVPEDKSIAEIKDEFYQLIKVAHSYDMEVIIDVAPFVFSKLGITYDDLSFFHDIGADGIRLDETFDSQKEALMTYNKYNLKIEVNASFGNGYINNIMSHHPRSGYLITCHNFYPQKYSGLSLEHFNKCAKDIKAHSIPIAAFVTSQNKEAFGPWPLNEGLCTLELHRDLPLDVQVRHLYATGIVDDIIIANAYATEAELKELAKAQPGAIAMKIAYETEVTDIESKIIYDHQHFVRGDVSEYMYRSTMPRVTHAKDSIPPKHTRDLKPGDIVVLNDNYGRYKGELHIVLKEMANEGNKNVIGSIPQEEMMLMDYLAPWKAFSFVK